MEGKKVLVVDDEKDLREAIADALRSESYEVLEAADGKEGLALALKYKPDIILLDIMMPKMDGNQVLRQLRSDRWGKHVKVIMLTALSDAAHITKTVRTGGNDYLIKSQMQLKDVLKKVKQHIIGYE